MSLRLFLTCATGLAILTGPVLADDNRDPDWAEKIRAKLRQAKLRPAARGTIQPRTTAEGSEEPFRVEANYRGVVNKSFDALGKGILRCKPLGPSTFSVELYAKAKYPGKDDEKDEAKKNIEFKVSRKFELAGKNIKVLDQKNWFNETAAKYQNKILNTVSLAYLIKYATPRGENGPWPDASYVIEGRTYFLTHHKVKNTLEVTLRDDQGEKPIGKFFLVANPSGIWAFEFFRVNTRDEINVEFWIEPVEAKELGGN